MTTMPTNQAARRHLALSLVLLSACTAGEHEGGDDEAAEDESAGESGDTGDAGDGDGDDAGDDAGMQCADASEGAPLIRRLTHHEWGASASDLLGVAVPQAASFAPDNVVEGWTNDASVLSVSALLADQYRGAAEQLTASLDVPSLIGCDAQVDELGCIDAFIDEFGTRAFRRPLDADEHTRYFELYALVADEDGYEEGVRWVVATMLQSPGFLYRTELGEPLGEGRLALTDYELAAELSYLILGTTPDAELMDAAAAGQLGEVEALLAQAERLLADPRASTRLDRFTDDWLHLPLLATVTRDPALTPELRTSMIGEARRAFARRFMAEGTLAQLLTDRSTWVDPALAAFLGYGAGEQPDAEGFALTQLPDHVDGGLLARAGVLATHALPTSSSPIHRGKLVRERLLCQPLPPPPPALDTSPPEPDPSKSTRERYEQHTADPACAGCHLLIDGIGFAFEHYDALGRWREMDGEHPIDAQGELTATEHSNGEFEGLGELSTLLAASPDVSDCYVEQWSRFALGSKAASECVRDDLELALADAEGRLDAVLFALISADHFRFRRSEGAGDPPTPEPDPDTGEGSDDETTSGGETGEGDSADEGEPMQDVVVEVVTDNDWGAGACKTATLTNTTMQTIAWQVELDTGGTLTTVWNALTDDPGPLATFVGDGYNAELAGGATTSFGFCIVK